MRGVREGEVVVFGQHGILNTMSLRHKTLASPDGSFAGLRVDVASLRHALYCGTGLPREKQCLNKSSSKKGERGPG